MLAQLWVRKGLLFYFYSTIILAIVIFILASVEPIYYNEGCNLGSDIECLDYNIGPTGAVIALKNNLNEDIILESARFEDCEVWYKDFEVESGKMTQIALDGCDIEKERVMGDLEIAYRLKGGLTSILITGNMAGAITKINIYADYSKFHGIGTENNSYKSK